jgi:Anti-sigma factor NepR
MNMNPKPEQAKLTRDIQINIGQQLRAMYTNVIDHGVPDRFVALLRQFDQESGKTGRE